MRISTLLRTCGAAALLVAAVSRAEVQPDGSDPERTPSTSAPSATDPGCRILWYTYATSGVPPDVVRLRDVGFNIAVTSVTSDLTPLSLANYDVLVVAYTPSGWIGSRAAGIASMLSAGMGLLIHQPNTTGTLDYAPPGFGVQIDSPYWCGFPVAYDMDLVDATHPVTLNLTANDLPHNGDQVGAIGAGYTVLARSGLCADVALAAGTFGRGHVVFETGNASYNSINGGSDQFWRQLFGWLCPAPLPTGARGPTWGALKAHYR